jgi:hypothetical protein
MGLPSPEGTAMTSIRVLRKLPAFSGRVTHVPAVIAMATGLLLIFPTSPIARSPVREGAALLPAAGEVSQDHNGNLLQLTSTNRGRFLRDNGHQPAARVGNSAVLYEGTLLIGAIGPDLRPHVSNARYLEFNPDAAPAGNYHDAQAGDPGGNRPGLGRNPDDDFDGEWDEEERNGLDDDGDGRIDEDFEAIGDRMWVVAFHDDGPDESTSYDRVPLGIHVQQKIIQSNSAGAETFDAIEYRVKNTGTQHLTNIYLAFYADTDVGPQGNSQYWTDDAVDYSRIDTLVASSNPGSPPESLSLDLAYGYDVPDNGATITGGDVPDRIGILFLDHPTDPTGVSAPPRVGMTSFRKAETTAQFGWSLTYRDVDMYDLMSQPRFDTFSSYPSDYHILVSVGPFAILDTGETMTFALGLVTGDGPSDLRRRAVNALLSYRGKLVDGDLNAATGPDGRETPVHWTAGYPLASPQSNVADPPPSPVVFADPAADRRIRVEWNDVPERFPDPTGIVAFEGYQIWRVDDWKRGIYPDKPGPEEWKLLATYRLHPPDSLAAESPAYLDRVRSGPGRYAWTEIEGIQNGRLYYYAVTTLGLNWKWNPDLLQYYLRDVMGTPSSAQKLLVMPAWPPGSGCSTVRVVPNPYHGSAPWDLAPSDCDPSGARIAFRTLPEDWTRLDIYTLTGDLVFTGRPEESRAVGECESRAGDDIAGTFIWDLRNDRGDEVESGIYLYAVENRRDLCRGHFAIIR